jgi:hypothetical protein
VKAEDLKVLWPSGLMVAERDSSDETRLISFMILISPGLTVDQGGFISVDDFQYFIVLKSSVVLTDTLLSTIKLLSHHG